MSSEIDALVGRIAKATLRQIELHDVISCKRNPSEESHRPGIPPAITS